MFKTGSFIPSILVLILTLSINHWGVNMSLDPIKMLERCKAGQWDVNDFDWNKTPEVTLSKEDELRVVQLYLNMSYIELLAGNLFQALRDRMEDPVLKEIYNWCYIDEVRHSEAAARLAKYFDQHQYKVYTPNIAMLKFIPHFSGAVRTLNPAIANSLILTGELILDIALLRGLNNYVDDPQSRAVVERINSDESRHLAMDFFMAEYCSENDMSIHTGKHKRGIFNPNLRGMAIFGPSFFNEVFFRPMEVLDPNNVQMESVARRLRRFNLKDEVQKNPTIKPFNAMADFFESNLGSGLGWLLRKSAKRIAGVDFDFVLAGHSEKIGLNKGERIIGDSGKGATELAEEIMREEEEAAA